MLRLKKKSLKWQPLGPGCPQHQERVQRGGEAGCGAVDVLPLQAVPRRVDLHYPRHDYIGQGCLFQCFVRNRTSIHLNKVKQSHVDFVW